MQDSWVMHFQIYAGFNAAHIFVYNYLDNRCDLPTSENSTYKILIDWNFVVTLSLIIRRRFFFSREPPIFNVRILQPQLLGILSGSLHVHVICVFGLPDREQASWPKQNTNKMLPGLMREHQWEIITLENFLGIRSRVNHKLYLLSDPFLSVTCCDIFLWPYLETQLDGQAILACDMNLGGIFQVRN